MSGSKLYYTKDNQVMKAILNQCPNIISCSYKPPFLLPINPLQLIFLNTAKVKPAYKPKVTRQNVGDSGITLDWVEYIGKIPDKGKVLIIFPGLTGSIEDTYVMNIADKALLDNYNVAIYQMRVLNENVKLPQDGSHMNLIADVAQAVDAVIEKFGSDAKIYGVGYSYGANQLVKYLGEYNNKEKKMQCGVSISNPYEFEVSAKMCEHTIYDRMLLSFLQKAYKKTGDALEKDKIGLKGDIIRNTISLHEFDENYTAPILGFESPMDYYRNIGSAQKMKGVTVPLLCIHAMDDCVTSSKVIPYDDVKLNKNCVLLTTDKGTHSCFLEGENIFNLKQWVNKPTMEFINAVNNIISTN